MKKINLLIPLAATVAGVIPAVAMTGCHKPTDDKSLTSNNSFMWYKHKLSSVPASQKVDIEVTNSEENTEPVMLFDALTHEAKTKLENVEVNSKGEVEIPLGFTYAPSINATSKFDLTYTFVDEASNSTQEQVKDLKFNYVIDYGDDLLVREYPQQTPADATHWDDEFGTIYSKDVLLDPNIFQNDARYTTSVRMREAVESGESVFENLNEFKAYFNDIIEEGSGLHIHMNYKLKGDKFTFVQKQADADDITWTFSNFNCSFTFETPDGYAITYKEGGKGSDPVTFQIIDKSSEGKYKLDGRFNGSFCYSRQEGQESPTQGEIALGEVSKIDNYSTWDPEDPQAVKNNAAGMLAFGIIQLTYGFNWTSETPELTMFSPYGLNYTKA